VGSYVWRSVVGCGVVRDMIGDVTVDGRGDERRPSVMISRLSCYFVLFNSKHKRLHPIACLVLSS